LAVLIIIATEVTVFCVATVTSLSWESCPGGAGVEKYLKSLFEEPNLDIPIVLEIQQIYQRNIINLLYYPFPLELSLFTFH